MDSSGLRRKDTIKGPPLRILSLDGGGVRGYSMLIILQRLMHLTFVAIRGRAPERHEIPKPCDHFDLIVGTGTGGLIAIMLGRLRLDIDTCKDVYVRMTRVVFESDKTLALVLGYSKKSMFKATMLEQAIQDCVREHTIFEDEGNDALANAQDIRSPSSTTVPGSPLNATGRVSRSGSSASRYSQVGMNPINIRAPMGATRWGNPNALLYDTRENRTKTAVTAVYKSDGTDQNAPAALLRSYDSRKEPAPEVHCKIWEAGRATSATGLAFKEIQIGQSIFKDEGNGKYNPAPQVLDEAVLNEWPGRDVGVFISIGTGKRSGNTDDHERSGLTRLLGMTELADARRKLLAKIEGCEQTHRFMVHEHLKARNTKVEDYYRFNVEVGVGDFGMNEWNRLADISTRTSIYLDKHDVDVMTEEAAVKMGRIYQANIRWDNAFKQGHADDWDRDSWRYSWESGHNVKPAAPQQNNYVPPADPNAVELPGDFGPVSSDWHPSAYKQYESLHRPSIADQKFSIVPDSDPNNPDYSLPQPVDPNDPDTLPGSQNPDRLPHFPQPSDPPRPPPRHPSHRYSRSDNAPVSALSPRDRDSMAFPGESPVSLRRSTGERKSPPPLPPKTPIDEDDKAGRRRRYEGGLPYPLEDGPPPVVNMARKPEFGVR
ncbi:FabD/lysophospholipase-like protein [Viridothelium virens]|uniref:FabD/lysophospholipase-like protein n=1 Tax=Viridothelium virens TaxID=1048519 RepID=A0A6A6H9Q2_VIRVR|nr:FabD/lysophospholipase-like protein [Viridothelium virens]